MSLKLVCISDTHRLHEQLILPDGDVLVHAGDIGCEALDSFQFNRFCQWLDQQPHKYKVVIPGNHDWWIWSNQNQAKKLCPHLLIDDEVVIEGLKFYGSPWQPEFYDWAWNLPRGPKLEMVWNMIPQDTDVLVTHGPPMGIMDWSIYDKVHCGCQDLANKIYELDLKAHVFGHIHHGYGTKWLDRTQYVNASTCDEQYRPINPPITINI